jgi:hypothetical protein
MLGAEQPLRWRAVEGRVAVEVPRLSVDELPCEYAYVIKVTHIDNARGPTLRPQLSEQ